MGFKRTTDGRVFFHNPEDSPPNSAGLANGAARAPDAMQAQIVSLLKTLNLRLQSTQADRAQLQKELETYKAIVLDLQSKSENYERKAQELEKKIGAADAANALKKSEESRKIAAEALKEFEDARRLLLEIEDKTHKTDIALKQQQTRTVKVEEDVRIKWSALEQSQKKQANDLMARIDLSEMEQKTLSGKVEEAVATSLRVDRKLEKSVQERARFLRKLERIEETVLQTHEALNARAMVLLTDQAAQGGAIMPSSYAALPGSPVSEPAQEMPEDLPWWRLKARVSTVTVAALLVGGILTGWMISQSQIPQISLESVPQTTIYAPQQAESTETESVLSWPESGEASEASETAETTALAETIAASPVEQEPIAPEPNPIEDLGQANDIGAVDLNDEEKLLSMLEENPDALAERLNAIEPSSLPPEDTISGNNSSIQAAPREEKVEPLAKTEMKLPPADMPLPSVLKGRLGDRMQPDSNLPQTIKAIQDKAFDGNAEAQHDLAAIYIAGHGGVEQDYKRAAQWFEEAAHGGVANARYNLGVLYHQGIGLKQDLKTAFAWYETAAALGHPEAQYNLGIAYIEGVGVEYNPQKAEMYFENSANAGVMEAAYNLGLIYENGLLGTTKPDVALMWYKKAADKGSPEAKAALEQLAKTVGIKLEDVNRLVEGMETLKDKKPSAAKQASQPAKEQSSVFSETETNLVAQAQEQLMLLGLYPGPADGVNGMLTRDAIRSYQAANNLPVTGTISSDLLRSMRENVSSEMKDIGQQR